MTPLTLLAILLSPTSAQPPPPRTALIYSDFGDFRHRDDYDGKLKSMGWPLTKLENQNIADWIGRLGEFDLVVGSALFNYANVQDFGASSDEWLKFMRNGGGLVLTDCNYPSHVNWLQALGEDWGLGHQTCESTATRVTDRIAAHPLLSLPHRYLGASTCWAQMLPEKGDAWQVLSTCEEGGATAVVRSHGRGFLLATTHWNYDPKFLENIWTCLQGHRAGKILAGLDLPEPRAGENTVDVRLWNTAQTEWPLQLALEARTIDVKPPGVATASERLQLPPQSLTRWEPTVGLSRHTYELAVVSEPPEELLSASAEFTIPPLLTVELIEPAYRRTAYLAAPPKQLRFACRLNLFDERLEDIQVELRLASLREEGKIVATRTLAPPPATEFEIAFDVPPGGDAIYSPLTKAVHPDGETHQSWPAIYVRDGGKTKPLVFIDPTGACWVDGERFFPIGIYHIPVEALPRARRMGFNSIVAWGTTEDGARKFLDAADELGLKVLLEMSSFLRGEPRLDGMSRVINTFRDHPALLTWYTVDEPHGEMLRVCRKAYDSIVSPGTNADPNHPVYLVMCSPGEFDRFGTTTDILAVDPYPIPHTSVNMVAAWMKRAQDAVRGRKPIWMIPQLHNQLAYRDRTEGRGPTPAEERCMVYQGIICGAKGIIYYPWDDGPCGLVHDEALMAEVAQINAELGQIGVELLRSDRTLIQPEPEAENAHAALFTGPEHTYLIVANGADEQRRLSFRVDARAAELPFEDRQIEAANGLLTDDFPPLGVHVYRW